MKTFQRIGLTLGWFAFVVMLLTDWRAATAITTSCVLCLVSWRAGRHEEARQARKTARRQFRERQADGQNGPVADHVMGRCVSQPMMRLATGERTGARLGVVKFGERVFMGKFESDEVSVRRAANYRWN